MNKKSKLIIAAIAVVMLIAVVILAVVVRGNNKAGPGLIIQAGGKTVTVSWEDINQTFFTGEIVNGKGELSSHEYRGTELFALFEAKGIEIREDTKITAGSEDNYTAELTGAEVMEEGKVYAAVVCDDEMIGNIDGGQGGQLVVYGDPNAKRQVRYLKTITVGDPAGK
ncbi:MAG: hypothetical protein K6G61_07280 [Solobacterium sp.]|nr:hypothetical protein [Solobacterium sp.]